MQWRLDGSFLFPGGHVSGITTNTPPTFSKFVETVVNNLYEQMGFGKDISPSYVYSCYPSGTKEMLMLHFFTIELSPTQFEAVNRHPVISEL
ncbi:hypothetical protein Ocin01_17020 [Orchesella cincta]|uniref:Uncharacterized protein n=1 Tax=Orchesella cincta TaxID=48709 RepID=A0A1D2M9K4_ORCCI|nr:hypothetical protein Ocin01_17020 [Orchesella cincta]